MRTNRICLLTIYVFVMVFTASSQYRVSGYVKDQITGENLIGAHIIQLDTRNATLTDNNGFFTFFLESTHIIFSFVGYESKTLNLKPQSDTVINVFLNAGKSLEEIEIVANRPTDFHLLKLSSKELYTLPSLSGKPDILKSFQLLPGVSSQNEGSSLLLVRGGNPGDNLYLLDNIGLLYVNHLGGFTSVFNPDMINDVSLYKGGFPAKFGGKLSSVLDIIQKEGDTSRVIGSLSLGLTDISFSLEGPAKIKNTSFIVTGRKTFIDAFMLGYTAMSNIDDYIFMYGFHDVNGKFTWMPDSKNVIQMNMYQGDDYLNFWYHEAKEKKSPEEEKYHMLNTWGNYMSALHWKHRFNSGVVVNNSMSYSRYRLKDDKYFTITGISDTSHFEEEYKAIIRNYSFQSNWIHTVNNNWKLSFGGNSIFWQYNPNIFVSSSASQNSSDEFQNANENAIYFQNDFRFFSKFIINAGIRFVYFAMPETNFLKAEPRLDIQVHVTDNFKMNASYDRMDQFGHLIFAGGNIINNEVWILSNNEFLPSVSDQFSVGISKNLFANKIELKFDGYWKNMDNLVTMKQGYTNLKGDHNWESKLEKGGAGNSRGFELYLKKNGGLWTGFFGYSFTQTSRKFENINKGKSFVYDYDRPHQLSLSVNKQFGKKWNLCGVWVYQTGLPFTPALGRQITPVLENFNASDLNNSEALIFGERNSSRMKDYHRLDLSLNYYKKSKFVGNSVVWTFGIYNVYNRKNPYLYYYNYNNSDSFFSNSNSNNSQLKLYQVSFFPIIPTIAYKIIFDGDKNARNKKEHKFHKWLYYEQ